MELLCSAIEILASFTEGILILSTIITAAGPKYGKVKTYWLTFFCAVLTTGYLIVMNAWSGFSFITPIGGILFYIFFAGKWLSKGKLALRTISCVLAFFVVQTIDYILIIGEALLYGNPQNFFYHCLQPGWPRIGYLFLDKGCDIVLFYLLRKHLTKLSILRNNTIIRLCVCTALSYGAMQYLFAMVLYGDFIQLQGAAMISFFILLCFLFILVFSTITLTASEKEKATNLMLGKLNQMMEENYYMLNQTILDHAKVVHDFHHHLSAISTLSQNGECAQIPEYIHSLLSTSFIPVKLCRSGSSIVDAVINSKLSEAGQKEIQAEYEIHINDLTSFEPADICAILSNQIENAFEACEKLEQGRKVQIDIRQQGNFVLFRVANPVVQDPFITNRDLASTKTDTTRMHGMGLKNLQDIAGKYNGSLKNEYAGGHFISTVLLCVDTV